MTRTSVEQVADRYGPTPYQICELLQIFWLRIDLTAINRSLIDCRHNRGGFRNPLKKPAS